MEITFESFDLAYLEALQRGEESTEEHFVCYFSELIVLKMRSRGYRREETEEVLQETFARALLLIRSPGGVRDASRLGVLVNSICNNVMREQYRTKQRMEPLDADTAAMLPESRADALSNLIAQDTGDAVSSVLQQLSPRDRELLRALLLEEADKDAVCERMGVSRDHLRVLLHRAKLSFRSQYASSFPPVGHKSSKR